MVLKLFLYRDISVEWGVVIEVSGVEVGGAEHPVNIIAVVASKVVVRDLIM